MLRLLAFAFAAASIVCACGSSKSDDLFTGRPTETASLPGNSDAAAGSQGADGSAGPPSSGGADGGSAADATTTTDAGAPGVDAGTSCAKLFQIVTARRGEAVACSVIAPSAQCGEHVDDLCCKLWVTSKDGKAAVDFVAAVDAFLDAKCEADCDNVQCGDGPTYACVPVSGARGSCAQ